MALAIVDCSQASFPTIARRIVAAASSARVRIVVALSDVSRE